MSIIKWLQGKKTHIVGFALAAFGVTRVIAGDPTGYETIAAGVLAMVGRAAFEKGVNRIGGTVDAAAKAAEAAKEATDAARRVRSQVDRVQSEVAEAADTIRTTSRR